MSSEDWRLKASCRNYDTEFFFPEKGEKGAEQASQAKAVCAECPVIEPCRDYIYEVRFRYEDDYGIFGGTTPEDRHQMRFDAKKARRKERRQAR